MNLPGEYDTLEKHPSRLPKRLALTLCLFLMLVAGCSDNTTPPPGPTQTANTAFMDEMNMRFSAEKTVEAAQPTRTIAPTAVADACTLLTEEEVTAAIGKPMQQVTSSSSGRCIYQGETEYLMANVYSGMTEDDAKKLFNSQWLNPAIPNGIPGGATTSYTYEKNVEDLGDEAFVAKTRESAPTVRRLVFVRQGSQVFFLQWLTTVIDRDLSQVAIDLTRKALSRL